MRMAVALILVLLALTYAVRTRSTDTADTRHIEFAAAIDSGDTQAIDRHLGTGYGIDSHTTGMTPLMRAVASGQADAVRFLLSRGADPNAANALGWTPLLVSVLNQRQDIIPILLDAGADPFARSESGTTAIDVARNLENAELERMLLPASPAPSLAATTLE